MSGQRLTLNANRGWGDYDYELEAGVIDDTAEHVFTHGHCHSLALALHEATGWDIIGSLSGWNGDDTPDHVGVLVPGPTPEVLDIHGTWDADDWLAEYGGVEWRRVDPEEAYGAFDRMYRKPDVEAARHWVYPVLEEYVPATEWVAA